jgi:hypothetical protein
MIDGQQGRVYFIARNHGAAAAVIGALYTFF